MSALSSKPTFFTRKMVYSWRFSEFHSIALLCSVAVPPPWFDCLPGWLDWATRDACCSPRVTLSLPFYCITNISEVESLSRSEISPSAETKLIPHSQLLPRMAPNRLGEFNLFFLRIRLTNPMKIPYPRAYRGASFQIINRSYPGSQHWSQNVG